MQFIPVMAKMNFLAS